MADVDPDMQKAFAKAGGAPPMPEADKDHMAKLAAKKREAMAAQVRAHDNAVPSLAVPSLAPARCPFWARKPPVSHVRSPPSRPDLALCRARLTLCAARRRLLLRLSRGSWRKRTRRKMRSRSVLRPAKRQRIRCADISCSHGPHFTAVFVGTAADLWWLWGGRLGRLGCPWRTAPRSLRSWSCWTAR